VELAPQSLKGGKMIPTVININVKVDFPALDLFIKYLVENKQSEVNNITLKVNSLTERLIVSSTKLEAVIKKEN